MLAQALVAVAQNLACVWINDEFTVAITLAIDNTLESVPESRVLSFGGSRHQSGSQGAVF